MMRLVFFLALFITISFTIKARELPLSHTDSAKVEQYMKTAFRCNLFSLQRQLYLDSALAIAPHYAWLWQQKSMPLFKQKKYETGLPFLDSAVKYDSGQWLEYRAFMKCIFQHSYRAAITDFDAARKVSGNTGVMDHPYDFYEALCYLQLNRHDSAASYLNRCIAGEMKGRDEGWVHYLHWFYLGIIHYDQGQYADAITCFDKSLKRYPNFSDAQYYKALSLESLGRRSDAVIEIKEAEVNFKAGYSIAEDNAFYEQYPYQVEKFYLEGMRKWLMGEK